jgi:hypothetical protein
MKPQFHLIVCIWLGLILSCAAEKPDLLSTLGCLKISMSPAEAAKVMTTGGAQLLADGTAVGAWGSIPSIPGSHEDASSKLGIDAPQAAQVWKIGERGIRLHYAPNKLSANKEPILFWIEVIHFTIKNSSGNDKASSDKPSDLPSLK